MSEQPTIPREAKQYSKRKCGLFSKQCERCGTTFSGTFQRIQLRRFCGLGCVNLKDLTGQRFGRLQVISRSDNKRGRAGWKCLCDCGQEKEFASTDLVHGATQSCGCLAREISSIAKLHDHTGKRFGMLTVLRRAEATESGRPRWECRCDCGNVTTVRAGNLRSGNISSCGCLLRRKGKANPNWRGGRQLRKDGYVTITIEVDSVWRTVNEHRFVMEQALGRRLRRNENVHHINGHRADNRLENLELWVKVQPCGQRVKDLVQFSLEILKTYAPKLLV